MEKLTQVEDFSDELFLEIFDYLNAFDILMTFSSLNKRVSSILYSTRLHVIMSKRHCRRQVEIFSSYLTNHDQQVVSLSLPDQLHGFSSVISFFFDHHTFLNLRSCKFFSICSSSRLASVVQQLENLTKLVSFVIDQPHKILLSDSNKQYLSQTMLTHRSSELRSIKLLFRFDHLGLIANTSLNSTVTSLTIMFSGSSYAYTIYCLLPVFRTYRALRRLWVRIPYEDSSSTLPAIESVFPVPFKDDLPISPLIKIVNLNIVTECNFVALSRILRCMPNLRQLIIAARCSPSISSFEGTMFDGYQWQQYLMSYTPHVNIIDLFLYITVNSSVLLDMNGIIQSFEYFITNFNDFHVAINRSQVRPDHQHQNVRLRAFTHSRKRRYSYYLGEAIVLGTLNMKSAETTDVQNHIFYSRYKDLHIFVPLNMEVVEISLPYPVFKNLDHLTIEIVSSNTTLQANELNAVDMHRTDDKIDQEERANKIMHLVDLTQIIKLELRSMNDASQLHFVQQILLASPNVIHLVAGTEMLLQTTLIDNPSLITIFSQLQSLYLTQKDVYCSSKYASKFVERFPSLVHVEFRILGLDAYECFVDTLLDGLSKLIHLKIFLTDKLHGDNPYSISYVVEKRLRAFPFNICDENGVFIKIEEQLLEIYLSGCSICAEVPYFS